MFVLMRCGRQQHRISFIVSYSSKESQHLRSCSCVLVSQSLAFWLLFLNLFSLSYILFKMSIILPNRDIFQVLCGNLHMKRPEKLDKSLLCKLYKIMQHTYTLTQIHITVIVFIWSHSQLNPLGLFKCSFLRYFFSFVFFLLLISSVLSAKSASYATKSD